MATNFKASHCVYKTVEMVQQMSYPDFVAFLGQPNTPPRGQHTIDDWLSMSLFNPDSVVLDLACTTGFSSRNIVQKVGCTAIGIDISSAAIVEARRQSLQHNLADKLEYIEGDASQGLFPNQFFSHVVAGGCFGFIEEREKARSVCATILRPRGHLCVSNFYYKNIPPTEVSDAVANAIGYRPKVERNYDYWKSFFAPQFTEIGERTYNLPVEDPLKVALSVRQFVFYEAEKLKNCDKRVLDACYHRLNNIRQVLNTHRVYQGVSVVVWQCHD